MTLKSLKCHRYQYGYTSLYIRLCILFENILIFINEIFFYLLLFQSSGLPAYRREREGFHLGRHKGICLRSRDRINLCDRLGK